MIWLGFTAIGAALVTLTWALLTAVDLDRRTQDDELSADIRRIHFTILISWAAVLVAAAAFLLVFKG